jgi:hypothetical protein
MFHYIQVPVRPDRKELFVVYECDPDFLCWCNAIKLMLYTYIVYILEGIFDVTLIIPYVYFKFLFIIVSPLLKGPTISGNSSFWRLYHMQLDPLNVINKDNNPCISWKIIIIYITILALLYWWYTKLLIDYLIVNPNQIDQAVLILKGFHWGFFDEWDRKFFV